jgi:hypothetical protein
MTLPNFARARVAIGSAPGGARTERGPAMPGTTKHELRDDERASAGAPTAHTPAKPSRSSAVRKAGSAGLPPGVISTPTGSATNC